MRNFSLTVSCKRMALAALIAIFSSTADAAPIGTANFHINGGFGFHCVDDFQLRLNFNLDPWGAYNIVMPITTADIGATFYASSGLGFDLAATKLTNGQNDDVQLIVFYIPMNSGTGISTNEALAFFGDVRGINGIDLIGYQIDSIQLTLNDLVLKHTPYGETRITADTTVVVHGHLDPNRHTAVPEPSTFLLLGSGLAVAVYSIRRRGRT